jgi:hypothetical protein
VNLGIGMRGGGVAVVVQRLGSARSGGAPQAPRGLPFVNLHCGGLLSWECRQMRSFERQTRPTARVQFCDQSSGPFARRRGGTKPARLCRYRVEGIPCGGVLVGRGNRAPVAAGRRGRLGPGYVRRPGMGSRTNHFPTCPQIGIVIMCSYLIWSRPVLLDRKPLKAGGGAFSHIRPTRALKTS